MYPEQLKKKTRKKQINKFQYVWKLFFLNIDSKEIVELDKCNGKWAFPSSDNVF